MTEFSSKAQLVIEAIGKAATRKIHREYPLRVDRNKKIREVRRRGVEYGVIAEICGLSVPHLKRICKRNLPATTAAQKRPDDVIHR